MKDPRGAQSGDINIGELHEIDLKVNRVQQIDQRGLEISADHDLIDLVAYTFM